MLASLLRPRASCAALLFSTVLACGSHGTSNDDSSRSQGDARAPDGSKSSASNSTGDAQLDSSSMPNEGGDAEPDGRDGDATERDATDANSIDGGACGAVVEHFGIPDVHVTFDDPTKCRFTLAQAAAGVSIPYTITVTKDVTGFVPSPYPYGTDVADLEITASIRGNGQSYCVCDLGLSLPGCPTADGGIEHPADAEPPNITCGPITIPAGVYHRTFTWDGKNWDGPSDTSNPEGAPFGPGVYELRVVTSSGAIGDAGGLSSEATLTVVLVP